MSVLSDYDDTRRERVAIRHSTSQGMMTITTQHRTSPLIRFAKVEGPKQQEPDSRVVRNRVNVSQRESCSQRRPVH